MLYQEMDVFTRREELLCISVYSVFTWKEKSQGISVDSTNDGNNCTTKKVNWKQTERQTDLLCEFLQRNTDLNYTLLSSSSRGDPDPERHTDTAFAVWFRINRVNSSFWQMEWMFLGLFWGLRAYLLISF